MTQPLKKSVIIPLPDGGEHALNITFRVIEIVERVYEKNADLVCSIDMANPARLIRTKIAAVIAEWLATEEKVGFTRQAIREHVMCSPPKLLNVYTGCIQGSVLYLLQYITEKQLEKLSKGESLEEKEKEGAPNPPSALVATS
jgi:hypothetical protein